MARRSAASQPLPQGIQQWRDSLDALMRFQRSYLQRVADYTTGVGDLTQARAIDPSEWIERYALFLSGVVHDVGDWMQERDGQQAGGASEVNMVMPVRRGKLRAKEGTMGLPLHVPAWAFVGRRGPDPKLTLMTDGLSPEGGGTPLPSTHIVFVPPFVTRSKPEAELKIFDVAGAVSPNAKYRGFVWLKETRQLLAAVEIAVL